MDHVDAVRLPRRDVRSAAVGQIREAVARKAWPDQLTEAGLADIIDRDTSGRLSKRVLDVIVAGALLVFAAPLMFAISIAVRLDRCGPALFRQQRIGYRGRPFVMIKFRSMNGSDTGPAKLAHPGDRVTTVGRFLRRSRLDELPQLWNVLRGEMSLVGPRPHRPTIEAELIQAIPFYRLRRLEKPGITGWAQINFKFPETLQDHYEKWDYDLVYTARRSLRFDLYILLLTIGCAVELKGK
jgi:lipopolysaccharide/colanic/teichoic acid biosynthesis glycosyltransferase